MAAEQQQTETSSVKAALRNGKVWHLALIYGTLQIGVYGLMFFLPSQVASLMGTHLGFKASLVAAIPGRSLRWASISCRALPTETPPEDYRSPSPACRGGAGAGGFFLCRSFARYRRTELLCSQFPAVQPIFWTFPAQVLTGPALAAGIGFCTTLGAAFSF